ncbi:tRNA-int-end-N2 domain-containing protein [Mycena kentingensis (nom. inval.)]|nr:tRNA-int-end-N2 domain-containing protein [Mycena kentingensis (nom. inval.)]
MDDSLERPDAQPTAAGLDGDAQDDREEASDDEGDVVLDWSKLASVDCRTHLRGLTIFIVQLQRAPLSLDVERRNLNPTMEEDQGFRCTFSIERGTPCLRLSAQPEQYRGMCSLHHRTRAQSFVCSKAASYAMWHPDLRRAHVVLARGTHFASLGHSIPRPVSSEDGSEKLQKRLELLPEEALYLIERGSAFCWKEVNLDLTGIEGAEPILGAPMSVQQAYTEMIGSEDLTLERYQVYAYLKRLGYVVTRTTQPNPDYPIPPPFDLSPLSLRPLSIYERCQSLVPSWLSRLWTGHINWWRPLRLSTWTLWGRNYGTIFVGLRFLQSGHKVPLLVSKQDGAVGLPTATSPYRIFFNVHKPGTPYRKTSPSLPDYQIVVVNARTTPMPSLRELTDLFDVSPELPPPMPRQRRPGKATVPPPTPRAPPAWTKRFMDWLYNKPPKYTPPPRRPHPFMVMKAGKKAVIVAVVDSGNIGFFRFGQGAFEEQPMLK